jgi:flagellar M-ring protein FliF
MSIAAGIQAVWGRTTLMQRAMLGAAVLACGVSAILLTKWAQTPNMRLLYQDLAVEEAGKIADKISEKGIAYELRGDGTSIYVPDDKVYQLRLDMAKEGLPAGDQGGYKIFDNEKIGISPFVQGVNLNRALQDELARTIQMLDGVVYARVHLVRPEQTLFGTGTDKTTASVVLKLKPGLNLSAANVAAVTHLVAGSVEGLKSENVTIVDSMGKLLSSNQPTDAVSAGASTVLEYRERVEQTLAKKAQDMLAMVLGPGRATVSVAAVVNMTAANHTKETYDPTSKIATKEEIKSKSEIGAPTSADQGKTSTPSSQNKEETTTTEYVVGKVVEQKTEVPGEIISLSVSAVVDLTPDDPNKQTAAMTIKDVEEIIRNAIGLKTTDALKVVNARFHQNAATTAAAVEVDKEYESAQKWNRYIALARQASLGVLAICALLVLKIVSSGRRKVVEATGALATASPAGYLTAGEGPMEPAVLRNQISQALTSNPDEVKRLFSTWANEK